MKNHRKPNRFPSGMCANTIGKVEKPKPKVPPLTASAVPAMPRNTTAAVSVIMPPKPTSNSSFVAEAVRPERTRSSFFFMYEA